MVGLATQMAFSASRQMPSGKTERAAHSRRLRERAVGGDVEGGEAAADGLGGDQGLPSGVMTMPLGKRMLSAAMLRGAVGLDEHDA